MPLPPNSNPNTPSASAKLTKPLPSVEEAWNLPISNEMTNRQPSKGTKDGNKGPTHPQQQQAPQQPTTPQHPQPQARPQFYMSPQNLQVLNVKNISLVFFENYGLLTCF